MHSNMESIKIHKKQQLCPRWQATIKASNFFLLGRRSTSERAPKRSASISCCTQERIVARKNFIRVLTCTITFILARLGADLLKCTTHFDFQTYKPPSRPWHLAGLQQQSRCSTRNNLLDHCIKQIFIRIFFHFVFVSTRKLLLLASCFYWQVDSTRSQNFSGRTWQGLCTFKMRWRVQFALWGPRRLNHAACCSSVDWAPRVPVASISPPWTHSGRAPATHGLFAPPEH